MTYSKNYESAVEQGKVLHEYEPDTDPERLIMLGYMAGLQDSFKVMKESISVTTERGKAGRMYSVAHAKFVGLAQKAEARAKDLKV